MRSNKIKVVIDPGHGGSSVGAVGLSGTKEKDLNLKLSKFFQNVLEKQNFEILLTRDSDIDLPLENRCELAEEFKADIFISFHFNADPLKNSNVNRTEIYVPFEETGPSVDFANFLCNSFSQKFDIPCIGPIPSRYHVLRNRAPVKVLLECSYLSNPEEEEKLVRNEERLKTIAYIVYEALTSFTQKGFCLYKGYEIKENRELLFKFSMAPDVKTVEVEVDGANFHYFSLRGSNLVIPLDFLRGGKHLIEIKGKTLYGIGLQHIKEEIDIPFRVDYFVASITPYYGYETLKIKCFDERLNPIPEGVKISIEKIEASVRATRRGVYQPGELENLVEAKKEFSDKEGCFHILLKGLKDEIYFNFSVGELDGRLTVENLPKRRSNIVGFVYDDVSKTPLKDVLVKYEGSATYSKEFGIFEIEGPSEDEEVNVEFLKEGYYPVEKKLIAGAQEKIFLTPLFNGVLLNKKVLIDIDNKDTLESTSFRRSEIVSEYLEKLVKHAGGIVIKTREYPWKVIDDYTKVKLGIKESPDLSIQITNSKLNIKDGLYIFYYERSEESLKIASTIRDANTLQQLPSGDVMPYGNYFIIQLSGPRVCVNSRGLFETKDYYLLDEKEMAKNISLKIFLGILQYFGFKGVYYREYEVKEDLKEKGLLASEDFPFSISSKNSVYVFFARPDSKIVFHKFNGQKVLLNKPLEGKCITLPDGN